MIALLAVTLAHGFTSVPVLGDADGVSLRPGLLLDVRAGHVFEGDPMPLLQLQRARPAIRGTILGDRAGYFVQAELIDDVQLLDAVVQLKPLPDLHIDAGRFLLPFGRAQLTPVPKLLFQEFSASADAVRGGRDVGAEVRVTPGPIDLRAGLFQGQALLEDGGSPLGVAHAGLDLFGHVPYDETELGANPDGEGGLSVGVSGAAGTLIRGETDRIVAETGGADVAARVGPARLQAEGFMRRWDDGQLDRGAYAQLSVAPVPVIEVGTRFDVQHTAANAGGAQSLSLQGLATWYQDGDHLRLNAEYTWRHVDGTPAVHTVALQEQLWF